MPIKMTKELPTDAGLYLWSKSGLADDIESVSVCFTENPISQQKDFYSSTMRYGVVRCSVIGGYWAKVDKDQFEFVD